MSGSERPRPSRKLGLWSLVLALAPVAAAVVGFLITIVLGVAEPSGNAAYAALAISGIVIVGLTLPCGVVAVILGIIAITRNRGRGLGIAGVIIGALAVLTGLPFLAPFLMSGWPPSL